MNLSGNYLRQLAWLAVALFFFSCEDETSLIGFKNPNQKFDTRIVDIPLESSVLLLDSVKTGNFLFAGQPNAFLVGKYDDPIFGNIEATTYTQFFTSTLTAVQSGAIYDSAVLYLAFNLYHYGTSGKSTQTIAVHELEGDLVYGNRRMYNYNSTVSVKPTPLGTRDVSIDPELFKTFASKDTTVVVAIKLDQEFGSLLFSSAVAYRDRATTRDTSYVTYDQFISKFKGLAIKADLGDKIVGFNPASTSTRLALHYHTSAPDPADPNNLKNTNFATPLTLSSLASFNGIVADRSASELSALTPLVENTALDKRYIQSGTGVVTKIDLNNFLSFADTVADVNIFSAELVIDGVEESSFSPMSGLGLRVLSADNRIRKLPTLDNVINAIGGYWTSYAVGNQTQYIHSMFVDSDVLQSAVFSNDRGLYVFNDQSSPNILGYSSSQKKFTGYISTFLQRLAKTDEGNKITSLVLFPTVPNGNKSVNRAVFHKDNVKLRIKYLKPTVNTN